MLRNLIVATWALRSLLLSAALFTISVVHAETCTADVLGRLSKVAIAILDLDIQAVGQVVLVMLLRLAFAIDGILGMQHRARELWKKWPIRRA